MTTTTPSHDRPLAGVAVGGVPAQRPVPGERASPVAVPWPRQEPTPVPAPRRRPVLATPRRRSVLAAPRRRWAATADGLAAGLTACTVGAVGVVVALSTAGTLPTPTPVTTAVPPANVSPDVSVPGRVLTRVPDGVWQIGVDIAPGTYTSTGSVAGATCSHAVWTARTGGRMTASDIPTGRATVVLSEADGWFTTSGCATWTRTG